MHRSHAQKLRFLLFQKGKYANFRGKTEQITDSFRAYHTAICYLLHRQKLLLVAQKTHAESLIYCNCLTYNYLPNLHFLAIFLHFVASEILQAILRHIKQQNFLKPLSDILYIKICISELFAVFLHIVCT